MRYGSTGLATNLSSGGWGSRFLHLLFGFVPRANPDVENLFPQVRKWLLEVDESGVIYREIGLAENGQPLFAIPNQRNRGLWSDSAATFDASQLDPLEQAEFENLWQLAKGNRQKSGA